MVHFFFDNHHFCFCWYCLEGYCLLLVTIAMVLVGRGVTILCHRNRFSEVSYAVTKYRNYGLGTYLGFIQYWKYTLCCCKLYLKTKPAGSMAPNSPHRTLSPGLECTLECTWQAIHSRWHHLNCSGCVHSSQCHLWEIICTIVLSFPITWTAGGSLRTLE